MTDKEKKNQIGDILLDFYDEYDSNIINRPMIPNIYAGKILDSLQEEPVSEELEKEISKYINNNDRKLDNILIKNGILYIKINGITDIARHFANWQKQQMMKDAKSGTVQEDYQIILDDGAYIDLDPSMSLKPSFAVKAGERIKMIIIKQEEE